MLEKNIYFKINEDENSEILLVHCIIHRDLIIQTYNTGFNDAQISIVKCICDIKVTD